MPDRPSNGIGDDAEGRTWRIRRRDDARQITNQVIATLVAAGVMAFVAWICS